jgi:hypothetical protein
MHTTTQTQTKNKASNKHRQCFSGIIHTTIHRPSELHSLWHSSAHILPSPSTVGFGFILCWCTHHSIPYPTSIAHRIPWSRLPISLKLIFCYFPPRKSKVTSLAVAHQCTLGSIGQGTAVPQVIWPQRNQNIGWSSHHFQQGHRKLLNPEFLKDLLCVGPVQSCKEYLKETRLTQKMEEQPTDFIQILKILWIRQPGKGPEGNCRDGAGLLGAVKVVKVKMESLLSRTKQKNNSKVWRFWRRGSYWCLTLRTNPKNCARLQLCTEATATMQEDASARTLSNNCPAVNWHHPCH